MKNIFILCSLFFFQISQYCYAQGAEQEREYTRQRAAAAITSANNASIKQNEINNRPFESKWGSATGVLVRPSSSSSSSSGLSPERRAEVEQYRANEKRLAEERWKASYNTMIENQIKDGGQTAGFLQYYKGLNIFTENETWRLTNLTKKIDGPLNPQAAYYLSFGEKYKNYLTILEKGTFEEVLDALEPFAILPETALKELDKIEKKYPAQQREIDMARLGTLQYYFVPVNGVGDASSYEYNGMMQEKAPQYFEMAEMLFALGKKYPAELGAYFDAGKYESYYNPYIKVVDQYWLKFKKITDKMMQVEEMYLKIPRKNIAKVCWIENWRFLKKQDLAYFKVLAQRNNINPLNVFLTNGYDMEKYYYFSPERADNFYRKNADDYIFPNRVKSALKTLAEEGNPEAMHIYALAIEGGRIKGSKEDAKKYLRAAAEKNAPRAKENLKALFNE